MQYLCRNDESEKRKSLLKIDYLQILNFDFQTFFQLYLFPFTVAGFPKSLKTETDRRVSKNLTKFFTNMAKHGNPNPQASKKDVTITWEPQKRFSKRFLIFGDDPKVGELDFAMRKRIEFWNKIVREGGHSNWVPSDLKISRLYEETADKRSTLFNHWPSRAFINDVTQVSAFQTSTRPVLKTS